MHFSCLSLLIRRNSFFRSTPIPPRPQQDSLTSHCLDLDHMTPPAAKEAGRISELPQPLEWETSEKGWRMAAWLSARSPLSSKISILIHPHSRAGGPPANVQSEPPTKAEGGISRVNGGQQSPGTP